MYPPAARRDLSLKYIDPQAPYDHLKWNSVLISNMDDSPMKELKAISDKLDAAEAEMDIVEEELARLYRG